MRLWNPDFDQNLVSPEEQGNLQKKALMQLASGISGLGVEPREDDSIEATMSPLDFIPYERLGASAIQGSKALAAGANDVINSAPVKKFITEEMGSVGIKNPKSESFQGIKNIIKDEKTPPLPKENPTPISPNQASLEADTSEMDNMLSEAQSELAKNPELKRLHSEYYNLSRQVDQFKRGHPSRIPLLNKQQETLDKMQEIARQNPKYDEFAKEYNADPDNILSINYKK